MLSVANDPFMLSVVMLSASYTECLGTNAVSMNVLAGSAEHASLFCRAKITIAKSFVENFAEGEKKPLWVNVVTDH